MCCRTWAACVATSKPAIVAFPPVGFSTVQRMPHGRRLAGTVRAEQAEDLTWLGLEADVIHGMDDAAAQVAERFFEMLDEDHGEW